MKKTVIALSLCLSMLLLSQTSLAAENQQDFLESSNYKTIIVCDSNEYKSFRSTDDNGYCTVADLNSKSEEQISEYDLFIFEKQNLTNLSGTTAENIVNSGAVLCVQTENPNEVLSTLFDLMDEDCEINIVTNGVSQIGAFITYKNGILVPGVITEGTLRLSDGTEVNKIDGINGVSNIKSKLFDMIDTDNFLDKVFASRENKKPDEVSLMMAPSNFNREFDNYTTFNNGYNRGSAYITEYVYDICKYTSGGKTYAISDVVSSISVDAASNSYVKYYNTRVHCNITNMSCIDQTYIDSNGSYSKTFSGGFSADSDKIITGSVNGSTTYSYSTNNQTVTNDFAAPKYKNWNSDPTQDWFDASWVLEPGIRIKNNDASNYQSGAFTSVRKIAFYWVYMGSQNGTDIFSDPFEVGAYWNA